LINQYGVYSVITADLESERLLAIIDDELLRIVSQPDTAAVCIFDIGGEAARRLGEGMLMKELPGVLGKIATRITISHEGSVLEAPIDPEA